MTYWVGWLLLSIALTFIIVIIQFQSIKKSFHFAKQQPSDFGINLLIVSATLAISFLVSHKIFLIGFVTFLWLFLALMNAIVTHLRGYPLMFSDIFLIKEGLSLSAHYFKPWVIACIVLGIGLLIKLGYNWYQFQSSVVMFDYLWAIGYVTIASFIFNRVKVNSSDEEENERGFAFAMVNSIYPYVYRKPDCYNEEAMKAIAGNLVKEERSKTVHSPQVILLQLESFFDPLTLKGVYFSQDPIPTFRQLINDSQSGVMEVSTFGGGTAKTEFSVLTSMNADLLKPGEIPHHSFLKHTPVTSLASQLKHEGYQATLIHNYEGNFYNRHLAYSNLGFSRYIPIEYMSGVSKIHDLANMDDHDLIKYVLKTLNQDELSFICGITAGTHQPYDETTYDETHGIQVEGNLSYEMRCTLQNYAKRLYQLDQEIKWLLDELDKQSDEVILVMFSDHLPNLPCLTDKSMYSQDLFLVPYFISHHHPSFHCQFPKQLKAYELGWYLMKLMNVPLSLMQRIHETYTKDESYLDILRLVQYDQIEGKNYLTNEASNNSESKLQFGLGEQQIVSCEWSDEGLLVRGNGFNIDSQLYLDHKKVQTVYLSETQLLVPIDFKGFEVLTLKQLSRRHEALGEDVKFVLKGEQVVDKRM